MAGNAAEWVDDRVLNQSSWRDYRIQRYGQAGAYVYRCFKGYQFLMVGGGESAQEFKTFCETHERANA